MERNEQEEDVEVIGGNANLILDLSPFISLEKSQCLNEDNIHSLHSILSSDHSSSSTLFLQSSSDEQLLITIGFRMEVKIRSLRLKARKDGSAPSIIKLFLNDSSLDFAGLDSLKPIQTFQLSDADYQEEEGNSRIAQLSFNFVRFQKVHLLHIFVEDNLGHEESTIIEEISLTGSTNAKITKVNQVIEQ